MRRLAVLLVLIFSFGVSFASKNTDPYQDITAGLADGAAKKLWDKKIAVLAFDYVDGRSSPGGRDVAEELTSRFVQLGRFTVVERGLVEKVVKELEFQNSATVDPDTAKKLGKGLGVEAIVTGTLEDLPSGMVEVNARVIKTETYEIVAASVHEVKKTWTDASPEQLLAPFPRLPNPKIKLDLRTAGREIHIPVVNWQAYPDALFRKAPDLPPCGANPNASRAWVDIYDAGTNRRMYGYCTLAAAGDLATLAFTPTRPRGRVYVVIKDRGSDKTYKSNVLSWEKPVEKRPARITPVR